MRWRVATVAMCSLALASCHRKPPRTVPDVAAPEVVVPASARTSLGLTIYSGSNGPGYAFVREQRAVRIPAGRFSLRALEVASNIVPETSRFELVSFSSDGKQQKAAELYEQRYLYDQLSPARLLEKSEGQRATATWWAGGRSGHEQSLSGTLISSKGGALVRLDNGELLPVPSYARWSFPSMPPDLVQRPTLCWNVGSYEAAGATLNLSYRAQGFDWHADYVVVLDRAARSVDVEGWVTLTNNGDTAFDSAKLQLAAGTIHALQPPPPPMRFEAGLMDATAEMPAPSHATSEKLGEVHLYTLDHLSDLPARSSKQVRFVLARGVPITLEARTSTNLNSGAFAATLQARVEHAAGSPLAVPLPSGTARTSALSSQSVLVQVGERPTEHTPVGEPWRVPIASDPEQVTRVVVKSTRTIGRDRDKAGIVQHVVRYTLANRGQSPRHRIVWIEPDRGRLLRLSPQPGVRLDGPTRGVIELDLAPGQVRELELVIDFADPYHRPHRSELEPEQP